MLAAPARHPIVVRVFGDWVREVSRASLRADVLAGLLGAVLVLPQGIAFATLAGLPPQYGLYTAIVPCIVAALFGSSRHVMSGPTNANSLALLAMLAPLAVVGSPAYIHLALVVTLLVGLMQTAIGALRLGAIANFISPAALHGFTSGAAILIVVHALKDLLALPLPSGQGAGAVLIALAAQWRDTSPAALAVAVLTLAVVWLAKRTVPRWPAMLLGLVGASVAGVFIVTQAGWSLPVVGVLPAPWPPFEVPQVDWARLPDLIGLAFALTILALAQSYSIAKAIAARTGQHIDASREFLGQGLSNLVGPFFSSYVSCGSLNRSLPNVQAGARTPLAAVTSAFWLLLLVAFTGPLMAHIPKAAIAALLLLVAWSLIDRPRWRRLWWLERVDFGIAAATMLATVAIRMEVAILVGTILSLASFLWRTARPAMRTMGFDSDAADRPFVVIDGNPPGAKPECPQLKLLRMEGSVYFGATAHVADRLHELRAAPGAPKHLLVMSKSMNFIDLPGDELWRHELRARRAMGGELYFHRPRPQVLETWERTGFAVELGRDHIFRDKRGALATIVPTLDLDICARCTARIFHECPPPPDAAATAAPAPSSEKTPKKPATRDAI